MDLRSLYPTPPPATNTNVYSFFFGRPEQARWPDYPMTIELGTGRRQSFAEVTAKVKYASTMFATPASAGGMELGAGNSAEMVGIMSENSLEYLVLVHSLLANTTPFTLISPYSTGLELLHVCKVAKITCLFVQSKHVKHALTVAEEVKLPPSRIYIIDGHVKGHKSLSWIIDRGHQGHDLIHQARPATRDTLAFLVFSSGTSGLPKAVMITHGNIIFSLHQKAIVFEAASAVMQPTSNVSVCLAFLPMHHVFGLHVYCFRALLVPSTFVIMSKWNLDAALRAIAKYRVTHLTLIPSVIHQLVNHPQIATVDFTSVKNVGSGAADLPPQLAADLRALMPKDAVITHGYGMSECTISAMSQPLPGTLGGRGKFVSGSSGLLDPGMEARILREDGSEAPYNEGGELYLKGSNVSPGYWNNEDANKRTFIDGWLRTGDIFTVDENGYFFFVERVKDTLKISGSQVSPTEIEHVLLAHPENLIIDATVAGVSGGRTSDEKVPRAWVVLSVAGKKKGAAAVIHDLNAWQSKNLSKYKWTRGGIVVVKEIPKSLTGKTLRRVLVEEYKAQNLKANL